AADLYAAALRCVVPLCERLLGGRRDATAHVRRDGQGDLQRRAVRRDPPGELLSRLGGLHAVRCAVRLLHERRGLQRGRVVRELPVPIAAVTTRCLLPDTRAATETGFPLRSAEKCARLSKSRPLVRPGVAAP